MNLKYNIHFAAITYPPQYKKCYIYIEINQASLHLFFFQDHTLTSDVLSSIYPGWQQFSSVRRRLDPNGMFTNANVDRVLGASDVSGND